jgi:hypothetical protein
MKRKLISGLSIACVALIAVSSCKKNNDTTKVSTTGSTKSHNMGRNCMDCHKSGGPGDGWFTVGGTVYDSLGVNTFPNATVRFYTGPKGSGVMKYTFQVDGKGNFYNTNNVDFTTGLFASVEGPESTHYMSSTLPSGQCNSCHGVSVAHIWTK